MIKAIIRKELRENLKVAVPGLIGFSLLTWYVAHNYDLMMRNVEAGIVQLDNSRSQPLLSSSFLMQTAWLCGIFGAGLGFLQIFSERNRDLSAFLTHRPISRTGIFLGKITAGLLVYLVATGAPLTAFIIWDATPGHVAAPFEPGMAMPAVNLMLAGAAFYFAGILTAQRQARWYASRLLGIGLALAATIVAYGSTTGDIDPEPPDWAWPIVILAIAGTLGVAAWGSFRQHGLYRGQPVIARLALIPTIFIGSVLAFGMAFSFVTNVLWPGSSDSSWSGYTMTKAGAIYRQEIHNEQRYETDINGNLVFSGQRTQFYDLRGNLIMSKTNDAPMSPLEYSQQRVDEAGIQAVFDLKGKRVHYRDNRFYDLARRPNRAANNVVWYFWRRTGRVVAYATGNRRLVMSVGPDGFAADANGHGDRFAVTAMSENLWQLTYTATNAFSINLDRETIDTLFTTTPDEPIGGFTGTGRTNLLVVTRNWVHLLNESGEELAKTRYQPGYPDFGIVQMSVLHPLGRFAVWFEPTMPYEKQIKLKPHTHVVWLSENGAITNAADLPELPRQPPQKETMISHLTSLAQPWFTTVPNRIGPRFGQNVDFALSLIGTAISTGAGWWLGRRYRLGRGALIGWSIFILMIGPMALVTFMFVQEWPVRMKCPNCGKLRVVDHPDCEHCGAEFAPADKNGTEIFEPLGTN